jgi:effector-binding domain-containing protein
MEIDENCELRMENVLSFRKTLTVETLNSEIQKFEDLIAKNGAKRTGPYVSTTFSVNGGAVDSEYLLPLDRTFSVPAEYKWKPHFLLTNALRIKHFGSPATIQSDVNKLNQYIVDHHLVPISTGYLVTVKDAPSPERQDEMEIDVYVGVSPNLL